MSIFGLLKNCHRLWVTANAAHFLGQLPQRSKLSYYFEHHVSWYLSPYSTSGYQRLSKQPFPYFQMARLTALGILRWNMGSDIKWHVAQKSVMVFIAVAADLWNVTHNQWQFFKSPKIDIKLILINSFVIYLYIFLQNKKSIACHMLSNFSIIFGRFGAKKTIGYFLGLLKMSHGLILLKIQ